ncbi:MAG: TolC family protein [Nitrospirota bacterium]|nr:TolC family protein [Nitrospirota bacterium]
MKKNDIITACFVCLFFITLLIPVYGQDSLEKEKGKVVFDLKQCIKKAVEVSPEIGESRYEEEVYKSKKMQADSADYPQIEIIALTGPSPEARKDEFLKTDISDSSINGVFGSFTLNVVQPIYTFGKISSYKSAASSGIKVARAGVDKKTSDIILRTKEFYYGLLLAKDMKNLVLEIHDELTRSIEKTEKQLEADSPWADEINLYKFRAVLGEAEKNLNEIEKGIALVKDALRTSMGLPRGTEFDTADSSLTPEEQVPDELNTYPEITPVLRPEFVQLHEGLNAKRALIEVEKSNYYPHIFLGATGYIAGATNRDRLKNPYVSDIFGDRFIAAYLGLKWSIDFGITKGRVHEAEAEYAKLLEKKRFADEAIPLQVRKAYLDLEEAKKNILETKKAYTNAKKWLVSAIANYDMGIGEAKEITDAASAYALTKSSYLKSLYNHKLSYATLLYATGTDLKELK